MDLGERHKGLNKAYIDVQKHHDQEVDVHASLETTVDELYSCIRFEKPQETNNLLMESKMEKMSVVVWELKDQDVTLKKKLTKVPTIEQLELQ